MTARSRIEAWQEEYVTAHLDDRPRAAVARAAGVSVRTVYRIVREHGGTLLRRLSERDPRAVALVREHFPQMTGREIERAFGIPKGRAERIARDIGVRHTPQTLERLRREALERQAASRERIDYAAMARKCKALRRIDEYRVWEGKPQRTRYRLRRITARAYKARWHLCRHYGYAEAEGEPYTLLYDGGTRRVREEYYVRKYKFDFKEAEET